MEISQSCLILMYRRVICGDCIRSRFPAGANSSFLAIIPKVKSPSTFSDFRPISLVSCYYKVVSKILASRLSTVMSDIISDVQHGFRSNFQTLDCVMTANEVVHYLKSSDLQGMLLKLKFEKAYDSVEWPFLEDIIMMMGFGGRWRKWILECISTNRTSVLVNGSPSKEFLVGRGLRQGCPLSPFLFNLVGEALHLLLNRALERDIIHDIRNDSLGWSVSHIQYADDILLFLPFSRLDLLNTKALLRWFEAFSGLKINFTKSTLITINSEETESATAASSIGCRLESLPFAYLGSYVGFNARLLSSWRFVVEKMKKKLASWKGRLLSIGGRITLIRAALRSIPIYNMSIFKMPIGIINQCEGIMKKFLWNGEEEGRFLSKVSWDKVMKPIEQGGLGVDSLRTRNDSFLLRWMWQLLSGSNKIWAKIVRGQYGFHGLGDFRSVEQQKLSPIWRSIIDTCGSKSDIFHAWFDAFKLQVGDGNRSSYWWDSWLHGTPLAIRFPRLYELSTNKRGRIVDFFDSNNLEAPWHDSWIRPLGIEEIDDAHNLQLLRDDIRLQYGGNDKYIWQHDNTGNFSIPSCYSFINQIRSPAMADPRLAACWRVKVPYRVFFFLLVDAATKNCLEVLPPISSY